MQWVAGPLWGRGHEVVTTVGALVTAGGRIFYALDEGQTGIYTLPSKWNLVACDAFNGVSLWKRPIPGWGPPNGLGGFTSGFRPRRLVTDGDRVWLPMGEDAILTALDAATGKTIKTLDAGRGTTEILCADGVLVAVTVGKTGAAAKRKGVAAGGGPGLLAVRTDSLERLWNVPAPGLVADTLALAAGRIFYKAGYRLVALDVRTARPAWQTSLEGPPGKKPRPGPSRLMVSQRKVYVHSGVRLAAFSADTGRLLWERNDAPSVQGVLFAAAGLLWRTEDQRVIGHDPATGEVRRKIDASAVFTPGHHPRCYPSKATERYVITNNRGAEFVSLGADQHVENDWLRGNCGHGVMPANGLLYVPPNPCFCYHGVKLTGFNALAPAGKTERRKPKAESGLGKAENQKPKAEESARLEKGPAYAPIPHPQSLIPSSTDWPTYRHDAARTGATASEVSPQAALRWTARLGGPLTAPIVSGGLLYVAAKDQHTLHALAAVDGRSVWQFTAGGRIDSPPSVYGELVLFGSADGHVYCLRAADGELAWRFRAAPAERRIVAFGQLESVWRVHGSTLMADGIAYCTAGRSSYLDGGIWMYGLDPLTGDVRYETRLDTWSPTRVDAAGKPFIPGYHIEGALSDVLVSQGGSIFLGQYKFDRQLRPQEAPYLLPDAQHKSMGMALAGQPFTADNESQQDYEAVQRDWIERTQKDLVARLRTAHGSFSYGVRRMGLHLLSTSGLLDDSWFNRTYWMYSTVWPGFYIGHRGAKCGQLLVVGPEKTYAVQAFPSRNLQCPTFTPGKKGYLLLADANSNEPVLDDATFEVAKGWGFTRTNPPVWFQWVPIRIRAMVLAGQTLFVAGPPDLVDAADPYAALEGRGGGVLRAVSAADGRQLAELPLDGVPVFDGMAAAGGRLFLVTVDGRALCFGPRE